MTKPANDEIIEEIREILNRRWDTSNSEGCLLYIANDDKIENDFMELVTSREKRVAEEILSSIDEHDEDNYHGTYHYAISLGTYIELHKKYLGEAK